MSGFVNFGIRASGSASPTIPVNVTPPVIAQDGDQIILVSAGVWTGGAVVLTYDVVLPHTLVEGEYLADFVVTETGTNGLGNDTAASNTVIPFYDIVSAAETETLPAGYTVTRPTLNGASRFDETGTMVFEDADVARFDYDPSTLEFNGLYLEPESTNYITYSGTINTNGSGNVWSGGSVADNVTESPDGTINAFSFTEDTAAGGHIFGRYGTSNATDAFSTSVFLKYGSRQYAFVGASDGGGHFWDCADLVNRELTAYGNEGDGTRLDGGIQLIGDEYIRLFSYGTYYTGAALSSLVGLSDVADPIEWDYSFTGDGSITYGFGWQAEFGLPTSYIPTTSAAVTRPAEEHHINIPATVSSIRVSTDELADQDILVSSLTDEGSNIYTLVSANVTGTHVRTVEVTP